MAKMSPWLLCFLAVTGFFTLDASAFRMHATAPAPSLAQDCSAVVYDMMDCLDFVTAGSKVTKPPSSCCKGVAKVVKVSPYCLCEALDMAPTMGILVDMTRAIGLPDMCSVKIPPGKHCADVPSSAPEASPNAPVQSLPASPSPMNPSLLTPSSLPTSDAPVQAPSSDASTLMSSSLLLVVCLVVIAWLDV